MKTEITIRRLEKTDDRRSFYCGHPALDRFFRDYAGQNQFRFHLGVTYVATDEDRIFGYATVSLATLERRTLPDKKMRQRLPSYPLPVLRLARLAVDQSARGLGIGAALLRYVCMVAVRLSDEVGCLGLCTDAKPEAIDFYLKYGFVALKEAFEGTLHGEPSPMFLALETIKKAL